MEKTQAASAPCVYIMLLHYKVFYLTSVCIMQTFVLLVDLMAVLHIYRHHSEYVAKRGAYTLSVNDDFHDQLVNKPSEQQNNVGLECLDVS